MTITMTISVYSRDKKAVLKKVEKENRKVDPTYKRRPQNINNKLKSNNHDELMKINNELQKIVQTDTLIFSAKLLLTTVTDR